MSITEDPRLISLSANVKNLSLIAGLRSDGLFCDENDVCQLYSDNPLKGRQLNIGLAALGFKKFFKITVDHNKCFIRLR